MKHHRPAVPPVRPVRCILNVGVALTVLALAALAQTPKSLLPVFGTQGREIQPKAKDGYDIRGWLPRDWIDNSSWAPVSALYSQLNDAPMEGLGAVRIEVTKLDGFHLQLTTKQGARDFKSGKTYVLSGWVRSPQNTGVFACFLQNAEPRDVYAGKDLEVSSDWKQFSFEWKPDIDSSAVMFHVHQVGIVDLAGIVLEEKQQALTAQWQVDSRWAVRLDDSVTWWCRAQVDTFLMTAKKGRCLHRCQFGA